MGTKRRNIVRAILFIGSTVTALLMCECGLRILQVTRDSYPVLFQSDPEFMFHYRASQNLETLFGSNITINKHGLRMTHDYEIEKPANTHRILILGDSVGFGLNVDDKNLYTNGLAEEVAAIVGKKVEIINGSCESYNTFNELAWYVKCGRAFNPDEVWLVYVSNDPALQASTFYVSPEGYSTERPNAVIPLSIRAQFRRSALLMLVHQAISARSVGTGEAGGGDIDQGALKASSAKVFFELVSAVTKKSTLKIFYVPRRSEIEGNKSSVAFQWLSEACNRAGLHLRDATSVMRKEAAGGLDLFLPKDPVHLSPSGHRVLRKVIVGSF